MLRLGHDDPLVYLSKKCILPQEVASYAKFFRPPHEERGPSEDANEQRNGCALQVDIDGELRVARNHRSDLSELERSTLCLSKQNQASNGLKSADLQLGHLSLARE